MIRISREFIDAWLSFMSSPLLSLSLSLCITHYLPAFFFSFLHTFIVDMLR